MKKLAINIVATFVILLGGYQLSAPSPAQANLSTPEASTQACCTGGGAECCGDTCQATRGGVQCT